MVLCAVGGETDAAWTGDEDSGEGMDGRNIGGGGDANASKPRVKAGVGNMVNMWES